MTGLSFGLDLDASELAHADHGIRELLAALTVPDGALACTHLLRGNDFHRPHIAMSCQLPDDADLPTLLSWVAKNGAGLALEDKRLGPQHLSFGALAALESGLSKSDGRAVVFDGADLLTGTISAGEVLAKSAITRFTVLGGTEPPSDARIHTRDHVRPQWLGGTLTLQLGYTATGDYTPFEVPRPTPCCAL
jgi:hypothetical protein